MQSNKNLERQLENELISNKQFTHTEQIARLKQNANQIDHQNVPSNASQINGKLKNGHCSYTSNKQNGSAIKQQARSQQLNEQPGVAPVQTFEVQNFDQIQQHYEGVHHHIAPTVELTQAHMMTTNFKEAAHIISGTSVTRPDDGYTQGPVANIGSVGVAAAATIEKQSTVDAGTGYYYKQDYMADLIHQCHTNDMQQVNRLLTNLGTQDKASNFLLEQRNFKRAQAKEGRDIRDIIQNEIVDNLQINRTEEEIAKARYRSKHLVNDNRDQDEEPSPPNSQEQNINARGHSLNDNQSNNQNKAVPEQGALKQASHFSSPLSSETQEDSGQNPMNVESNGKNSEPIYDSEKIAKVISQIRKYGQKFLAPKDGQEYASDLMTSQSSSQFTFNVKSLQDRILARKEKKMINGNNGIKNSGQVIKRNSTEYLSSPLPSGVVPLVTICKKLRQDKQFREYQSQKTKFKEKKRDLKAQQKTDEQFNGGKLYGLDIQDTSKQKAELTRKIEQIQSVMGLDKRLRVEEEQSLEIDKKLTATEIDIKPMNAKAFDIQNILFDFCKVNLENIKPIYDESNDLYSHQKRVERFFGKIRKLPNNSSLLQNYGDKLLDFNEEELDEDNDDVGWKEGNQRMVKVIGLEPEKLFEKIPKYRVQIDKLPKFSSHFDSIDSVYMGLQNKNQSIPGQSILNPISSQMSFQRIDGRQVISLQFNPFFLNENTDSEEKRKIYEQHMREILDSRDKIKNAPKEAKNKQEVQNFKRAWQNIVKKDIPKAYRMYQKYKADQENNNKKLSQNCLKEVRKRAVKTQRLAKESVMRARRLTKDMVQFWRRRDREIADSKRKREKMDKELKKRQQEEEEALLQKKRLEYLMQQSEIYAHFMSTKLGVNEDHKKGKDDIEKDGFKKDKRLDIDKKAARKQIAGIINENRKRLDEFDNNDRDEVDEEDLQEHKFNEPKQLTISVEPPRMFRGDLKAYQLKGLQWLDNLYDQGINGILADEMGLGKTIQAISLMAHLAEKKNVWGPFLIVVPVTTLHNWQNELAKFCPDLKVLPYFGSAEERKKLAKFLDPKNLYNPAMRIHVLITSYNIVVGGNSVNKDQMRLQRVKWHYMILDEAQAIKNNQSRRWKTLLNFQTRNRLLLSGTPIQNSMAELWALLHFIMPKLFDNHEQFQEWFSKDIEQHSMDQGELNKHQLKRLHLILQPFMLRRLKKDVEQEIAPKIEETISCEMTHRQKVLYDRIKRKISMQDLFQQVKIKAKMENLMNLVMQFRKVCNHPDLFERRLGKIPLAFSKMNHGMIPNLGMATRPEVVRSTATPIMIEFPKLIFDECFLVSDNNTQLFTRSVKYRDTAHNTISVQNHFGLFNIFNENNLYENIYNGEQGKFNGHNTFCILGLLAQSNSWSLSDLAYLAVAQSNTKSGDFVQVVALLHFYSKKQAMNQYLYVHNSDEDSILIDKFGCKYQDKTCLMRPYQQKVDAIIVDFVNRNDWSVLYKDSMEENIDLDVQGNWIQRQALIPKEPIEFLGYTYKLKTMVNIYYDNVISEPIDYHCRSTGFQRFFNSVRNNPMAKKVLVGKDFKPAHDYYIGRIGRDRSAFLYKDEGRPIYPHLGKTFECGPPLGYQLIDNGILEANYQIKGSSTFQLPDYSRMITDCSKMAVLADLLQKLHKNNHRCLIFCQMTKMMDILEDFLIWQKFSYFRMDGSTMLQDRRFMVEEYQTNPSVFAFILSTRAGGLGINLIAADTVIFYDNDWNPTMDSQATDRAHRIGQRKTVHVYRLVTKNTVEERILLRARQKESVQSTVYGANLKADTFSARDAVEMIYDDIEDPLVNLGQKGTQVKGFIKGSSGLQSKKKAEGKKKKKKGDPDTSGVYLSVNRISLHDKYENEIDDLLNDVDPSIKERLAKKDTEIQEIQEDDEDAGDSGSDGEISQDSDIDPQDAKKRLLKMLEKKGAAKQVFNFEEDDVQEQQIQSGANPGAKPGDTQGGVTQAQNSAKKGAGRPRQVQGKQQYSDDEMEDEDAEY